MVLLVCHWCSVWGGQTRSTILQEKSQADAKRTGVSQGAKPHCLGSVLMYYEEVEEHVDGLMF